MGRGGGVPSGRPPSQAAYFVALAGVALLLLMLCCYFLYFCIKKINELSEHESLCGGPSSRAQPTPPRTEAYPVQPVVRDSATAMAKLCKELPSGGGRGTVFPVATSPAALLADTGAARAGGSLASGSDGATLSDDTATTSMESPPPPIAPISDRFMPVVIPATLTPRASAGVRTHDTLIPVPAGAGGARVLDALVPAVIGSRVRETLASNARARQAHVAGDVERARAREASLRHRFQLALNAQLTQSLFSGNQIHVRYKWLDGRLVGAWPTPRWEWIPSGRDAARERFGPERRDPLQLPAFELPPRYHNQPTPPNIHFTHMDLHNAIGGDLRAGLNGPGGASGTSSGSSGTSGAVGAGAAMLAFAALVLLARALERCLDQRLFKLLRRRSDEWFTPNVLATSHHVVEEGSTEGAVLESPDLPPGDPPPPYSLCLPKSPQIPGIAEPPPPYSACYVAFGGPHDPVPRVYLNGPTLNSFQDTGQPDQNRHNSAVPEGVEATTRDTRVADRGHLTRLAESSRDNIASETAAVFPNSLVA